MSEGAVALATWRDVETRWSGHGPLSDDEKKTAETRIDDACAVLRLVMPDIDRRMAGDPNLQIAATAKVADAVVRYMENPSGARSVQETIGPRAWGATFESGRPVGIYFTDEELAALRPSAAASHRPALGTAFVNARPGWAPTSSPWPVSRW